MWWWSCTNFTSPINLPNPVPKSSVNLNSFSHSKSSSQTFCESGQVFIYVICFFPPNNSAQFWHLEKIGELCPVALSFTSCASDCTRFFPPDNSARFWHLEKIGELCPVALSFTLCASDCVHSSHLPFTFHLQYATRRYGAYTSGPWLWNWLSVNAEE